MRAILSTSLMTAFFCAIFAGGVDALTDALSALQVMVLGAVSGGLGSLLAQLINRRSA